MKSQGKSTAAEVVLHITGDTDKGRKLTMAHKNVRILILKNGAIIHFKYYGFL